MRWKYAVICLLLLIGGGALYHMVTRSQRATIPPALAVRPTPPAAQPEVSETDRAAIYAAVLHQLYTHDDTFGGRYQASTLYIVLEHPAADTLKDRLVHLLADLPARIQWVHAETDAPTDPHTGMVVGQGMVMRLGDIRL